MYLDENNLHGWAMLQKLPINNFKWAKNMFDENFRKETMMKIVVQDMFLKLMLNILSIYKDNIKIYHF